MDEKIILDYLISQSNKTTFRYDSRFTESSMIMETLLQGFQVQNYNPLFLHPRDGGWRGFINEGSGKDFHIFYGHVVGRGKTFSGEGFLAGALQGDSRGYGDSKGWGLFDNSVGFGNEYELEVGDSVSVLDFLVPKIGEQI